MEIPGQSVRSRAEMRPPGAAGAGWVGALRLDRLVPIILALYLTPALLLVLVVGGVGMMVLAVAGTIRAIVHGREAWPRRPVGPQSF